MTTAIAPEADKDPWPDIPSEPPPPPEPQTEHVTASEQASAEHMAERIAKMRAELLTSSDLDNIPALEPIVEDYLFRDTLGRIYGASGTMKSFTTLDFAGCVGTGIPWHGHRTQQGTVIYLVAEGSKGIRKRVRAWEQHHQRHMENVYFLPRPVQAMEAEWYVLIELCRQMQPALIIIDTQARVTVGVEENSATEMGRVVQHMENLREASSACVLLVHHTGHDNDRGRGSTAVKGALQTEIGVSRSGKGADTEIKVSTGKQKDDEEMGDVVFAPVVVKLRGEAKEDGSPITSLVLVQLAAPAPGAPVPGSVEAIVAQLDKENVPTTHGRDRLRSECVRLGIEAKTSKLEEVARIRKNRTNYLPPNLPPSIFNNSEEAAPGEGADAVVSAGETCPAGEGADRGQPTADLPAPSLPLKEGAGGAAGPECSVCGERLDAQWAARGYTTHTSC
jgi:hypothetical protein